MNPGGTRLRERRLLAEQGEQADSLEARIRALEEAQDELAAAQAQTRAVGDNVLLNSECEFSDDAATNDPPAGGDEDFLCAFWFHHDAADTLLATADADLIKDAGHSGYASDDPDWSRDEGRLRWGDAARTIMQALVNVLAQPDNVWYVQFTATLRTDTPLPAGLTLTVGFWDNTPGQEKWVEGATLEIGAAVEGTPGTTSTEYLAIITTDDGEEYEAVMAAPLATAPDALNATDYVTVSWPPVPARVRVDLYRHRSGAYAKLTGDRGITSGTTSYNDYGDAGEAVGGFPSAANSTLKARVRDTSFAPVFGTIEVFRYAIKVPGDYDPSVTDAQALRFELSDATTDDRQIILDRFQLGQNYGGFQRSAFDLRITARVSVSASPTGGLQQAPTYGNDEPPDDGTGGVRRERTIA